jgi:acetyltransferase-like isoleucine patch superfamily enzyme
MSFSTDKAAVRIGKNVTINVDRFSIGDGVLIKDNVVIEGPEVSIGDYTVIGEDTEIVAKSSCQIGMNNWIGRNCIIDATGRLVIGNGVAVAAGCQLWTHMKFGDTLQGCRWEWKRELIIGDDVYFGGNSLVGPITAEDQSLALMGSVVTHDMAKNHVYAGVPAVDITHKVGTHYENVSVDEKFLRLQEILQQFMRGRSLEHEIQIVKAWPDKLRPEVTYFNVATREYTKRLTKTEIDFMLFLLMPIKFYPANP